ncbi:hypothetical protein [Leuconostoc citreum]|uniref:hypothetical protein n=1 Tax=Leuconostoc citreum TaxID=33964 RepID=UPI002073342F|nr:hypothetical protein [Leuconostoc citreum]
MELDKDKVIEKLIQQNATQSLAIVQLQTLTEQYEQHFAAQIQQENQTAEQAEEK